jgi:hypothetical protein
MTMSQLTGEFSACAPQYADLDELLGTQQLWQRDNKLKDLYSRFGRDPVDEIFRRRPDLDLGEMATLLASGTPAMRER